MYVYSGLCVDMMLFPGQATWESSINSSFEEYFVTCIHIYVYVLYMFLFILARLTQCLNPPTHSILEYCICYSPSYSLNILQHTKKPCVKPIEL